MFTPEFRPFIVIAILVKLIQWVLVRCCFMQDKRDLTVDNRLVCLHVEDQYDYTFFSDKKLSFLGVRTQIA